MTNLLRNQSEISETHWTMGNLDYSEWEEVGHTLMQIQGSINWWLGDWLNEGERAFGETYAQAIEVTGWNLSRLQSAKWVSSRVPKENRFKELSWSHHHLASKYEPNEQYTLLQSAVDAKLSTREFKTHLKEYDNDKLLMFGEGTFDVPSTSDTGRHPPTSPAGTERERTLPRQHQCPHCGHTMEIKDGA